MVAAIVWVSLTPSPPELDFEQGDKVGHLASYGFLMFWFAQLYAGHARIAYAAGFIAMGGALELVQGQLGFRSFDGLDMAANGLGVLLGWAAAGLFPRLLK